MKTEKEKIVLNTSKEAATFKTGISGWVDRHGRFYGKDERGARWSGATHILCPECGKPDSKNWIICADCRLEKAVVRYYKMERKEWDGETPLYSHRTDKYFFDSDDIEDDLSFYDCSIEFLRLIICKPVYLRQIDDSFFLDDMPEDSELSEEIWDAINVLNEAVKKQKPIAWEPGKYAAIMPGEKPVRSPGHKAGRGWPC